MAKPANNAPGAGAQNTGRSRSIIVAAQRMIGDLARLMKGEELKALSIKTAGDTPIELEIATAEGAGIAVGDAVTTAAGEVAPDGEHALESGEKIVVKDGLVESYTAAPEAAETTASTTETTASTETGEGETVEALRATLARERGEMSAFKSTTTNRIATLASLVSTGATAPVVDPITNPTQTSTTVSSTPGAVANANSAEAKQAAKDRIKAQKANGGKAPRRS